LKIIGKESNMITGLKDILCMAQEENKAVPAFNVYNLETLMGVAQAAEETGSPVILQVYSRLFTQGSARFLAPAILEQIEALSVPAAFHLDHGAGIPEVTKALRCGATGVMIDGSAYDFDKNVEMTCSAVVLARACGVGVEGEIGHVGSAAEGVTGDYTTVEEAVHFADATGVDALAVQVGTAHGRYKKAPKLAIDRIGEISRATGLPLVLHGGSGIPDEEVRKAIKAGIRKVNFGTDVCYAFLDQVFATSREKVAVDVFMKDAIASVAAYAKGRIALLRD